MKCDRIKELIMTVFVDGEASESERKHVEEHLVSCETCRVFHQEVMEKTVKPLRESGVKKPDEAVWSRIKDKIEQETPLEAAFKRLREALVPRRPALAWASLTVVLVAGILVWTLVAGRNGVNEYLEDQVYFVNSLGNGENGTYSDLGIPGEEFFL